MTIARPYLSVHAFFLAFAFFCLFALPGCSLLGGDGLEKPSALTVPYDTERRLVWAVAPLRNETGTTALDAFALTDTLVNTIQEVEGIEALPLNRTIAEMRATGLASIDTPAQALGLARSLGVDAVLVGTVTSWDPYEPPRLGVSLALFSRNSTMHTPVALEVDPLAMQAMSTDRFELDSGPKPYEALSSVALHLDARNHDVLTSVKEYAAGRRDPGSPLGASAYVRSMRLYEQFVCFEALSRLLDEERRRVAQLGAQQTVSAR